MNKILYPPLIFIGVLSPFYLYALIDFSLGGLILAVTSSPLLILVLWMSMDNFWINRRLPVICPNNYKYEMLESNEVAFVGTFSLADFKLLITKPVD